MVDRREFLITGLATLAGATINPGSSKAQDDSSKNYAYIADYPRILSGGKLNIPDNAIRVEFSSDNQIKITTLDEPEKKGEKKHRKSKVYNYRGDYFPEISYVEGKEKLIITGLEHLDVNQKINIRGLVTIDVPAAHPALNLHKGAEISFGATVYKDGKIDFEAYGKALEAIKSRAFKVDDGGKYFLTDNSDKSGDIQFVTAPKPVIKLPIVEVGNTLVRSAANKRMNGGIISKLEAAMLIQANGAGMVGRSGNLQNLLPPKMEIDPDTKSLSETNKRLDRIKFFLRILNPLSKAPVDWKAFADARLGSKSEELGRS